MENTICPLDNRYYDKISIVSKYFSYKNWIAYRLLIELKYYNFLYDLLPELHNNINIEKMDKFVNIEGNTANIQSIINIEKEIHHDIKAIELFLRNQYITLDIGDIKYREFIHFGLTSQDINSVAFSLQLKECITECILPTKRVKFLICLSIKPNSFNSYILLVIIS